jgi:transcription elongation factor Elf1
MVKLWRYFEYCYFCQKEAVTFICLYGTSLVQFKKDLSRVWAVCDKCKEKYFYQRAGTTDHEITYEEYIIHKVMAS